MRALATALVACFLSAVGVPSYADNAQTCDDGTGVQGVALVCTITHTRLVHLVATSPGNVHYSIDMQCLSDNPDGLCNNPRACDDPPGTVRYDVIRTIDLDEGKTQSEKVAEVCLTAGDVDEFNGVITKTMVIEAFKKLTWPASPLVIQPPDGRTLVNFDTNFLTTNTAPTTQSVTLLTQTVEIEATPSSWTWHYGDGADQTTNTPGAAYPDLQITHAYLTAHVTVHPSVDTTYTGRYRINGGAWQSLDDETVTVAGTAADLQILEARPVLVGSDG